MSTSHWLGLCVICLLLGAAAGHWFTPDRIETQVSDAVVTKAAYVTRTLVRTEVERHEKIRWREVVKPDGTVEREGSSETDTREVTEADTAATGTTENTRTHEAVTVSTRSRPDWSLSAGVEFAPLARLNPDYRVAIGRRVLGPVFLEGSITLDLNAWRDSRVGLGGRIEW